MEKIVMESETHLKKITLIESYISLLLRREKIEPQIQHLSDKTGEIKVLIKQCNQIMRGEYITVMQEYKSVMQKMQKLQLQVLNILTERRKTLQSQQNTGISCTGYGDSKTPRGILKPSNSVKSLLSVPGNQSNLKGERRTPQMYLDDYLQSPFVRKTKALPIPFQFLDFEVTISPEMFESIPKYMRGRETLDELVNFLDTILVPCFNEKYQLLHRHRDCIRNHVDLDLWKVYKDQVAYFPGQNFITQGDISRKIKKMLDKKSQNKITMLRHLGILQEQRKAQTVCYIWLASNIS